MVGDVTALAHLLVAGSRLPCLTHTSLPIVLSMWLPLEQYRNFLLPLAQAGTVAENFAAEFVSLGNQKILNSLNLIEGSISPFGAPSCCLWYDTPSRLIFYCSWASSPKRRRPGWALYEFEDFIEPRRPARGMHPWLQDWNGPQAKWAGHLERHLLWIERDGCQQVWQDMGFE